MEEFGSVVSSLEDIPSRKTKHANGLGNIGKTLEVNLGKMHVLCIANSSQLTEYGLIGWREDHFILPFSLL